MTGVLIRGGRILDPDSGRDEVGDVLIEGDRIVSVGGSLVPSGSDQIVIEARGHIVTPGLIDMHVHLREPGKEEEETILSGAMAAVAGGITSVACFPNTEPAIDNESEAEFQILQGTRAGFANVFPVGAITLGLAGERLSEMAGLARAGAVAFSDADRSVESAEIMRRGLLYARMLDRVVIAHGEDRSLRGSGVMNQGIVSMRLGLAGIPNAAEEIMIARDITLARITDGRLHITQLSTGGAVELMHRAKAAKLRVSSDVTPHHFTLTEEKVLTFDARYKMIPPLRTEADRQALIEGLREDVIDVIASGHAPHSAEEKEVEFPNAPFGVIGMETLFSVSYTELVRRSGLEPSSIIEKLTVNPARILGLYPDRGTLRAGSTADVTVFDIENERVIDDSRGRFFSRSRNTPFDKKRVVGTAVHVIVGGRHVFADGSHRTQPGPA